MTVQPAEVQLGRWGVHPGGYAIENWKVNGSEMPCLVKVGDHSRAEDDFYNPMADLQKWDERELFLRLADVPPWDGPAVVKFATEFGQLGLIPEVPTAVEPLQQWTDRCYELREAIWVFEQTRVHGVGDKLREHLRPVRKEGRISSWSYINRPLRLHGASLVIHPVPDVTFRERDYRKPAVLLLMMLLGKGLIGRVDTIPVYDHATDRPVLRTVPASLLGAAWLRLANAVGGGNAVRVCRECGKWFAISDGREHRRMFCSDACKMKQYRRKISNPTTKRTK